MSQKVNRNLSPQRNFSINTTFENVLHREVHYATSLKPLQKRKMEKDHVETSCRNTELECSLRPIQGRHLHAHKLSEGLIQAAWGWGGQSGSLKFKSDSIWKEQPRHSVPSQLHGRWNAVPGKAGRLEPLLSVLPWTDKKDCNLLHWFSYFVLKPYYFLT